MRQRHSLVRQALIIELALLVTLAGALTLSAGRALAKGGSYDPTWLDAFARPGRPNAWLVIPPEDDDGLAHTVMFVTPMPLKGPPPNLGSPVLVRGGYWATLTPTFRHSDAPTADYYPGTGIVHLRINAAAEIPTWYRLGPRRQELMDRYAAIAGDPALPDHPSELAVLLAARRATGENVQVRIDGHVLGRTEAAEFWRFAGTLDPVEDNLYATYARPTGPIPASGGQGDLSVDLGPLHLGPPLVARGERSVSLTLPRGRSIFYTFAPHSSLLFGATWTGGTQYPGYKLPPAFTSWLTGVAVSRGTAGTSLVARAALTVAALCAVAAAFALAVACWHVGGSAWESNPPRTTT